MTAGEGGKEQSGQLDFPLLCHELDHARNCTDVKATFSLPSYKTSSLFSGHLGPPVASQMDSKVVGVDELSFGWKRSQTEIRVSIEADC